MTLREIIEMGGWAMWPLLFFSIATISIILERLVFLLLHDLRVKDLRREIIRRIDDNDLSGAEEYCASLPRRTMGAPIFLAGLKVFHLGERRMDRVMESEVAERLNSLESTFDLLVALGSIAPITGFLGTVSGMIGAFKSIADAADVNAQLVAGGIFEALITTAFGLSIAIAAITAYNVYAHVVDKFASQIEETGNEIVTRLMLREET